MILRRLLTVTTTEVLDLQSDKDTTLFQICRVNIIYDCNKAVGSNREITIKSS